MSMKNSSDTIGNRTRDLPACSTEPQPTTASPVYIRYIYIGSGSSVGIATDYGLDGPGSNPSGDEIFRLPDRSWDPPSLL